MIEQLLDPDLVMLAAVVTLILTEGAKRLGNLPTRYVPLVALVVGGAVGWIFGPEFAPSNWRIDILSGVLGAATASGLYSGTKALARG